MTDRPILFSTPLVRALLDGRKTQTRRLAWRPNGRPSPWQEVRPGDRLWVREACCLRYFDGGRTAYRADWTETAAEICREPKWKPSIHMPRWASRLTLAVTATRIERVQEISEADARAEGVLYVPGHGEITPEDLRYDPGYSNFLDCRLGFWTLWNSLRGPGAWESNPEVVVLTFNVARRNIDAKEAA